MVLMKLNVVRVSDEEREKKGRSKLGDTILSFHHRESALVAFPLSYVQPQFQVYHQGLQLDLLYCVPGIWNYI